MQAACVAVVPAAGRGARVGSAQNKLLLPLDGRPVLAHTLAALSACPQVAEIVLAARPGEEADITALVDQAGVARPVRIVAGGATRQQSVYRGLLAAPEQYPLVAVHDGARPLVRPEEISACIDAAARVGGALLAVPVSDTVKQVGAGLVVRTLERRCLWAAQTPQVFRRDWLLEAHAAAAADGYEGTDDAELVERLGRPVAVVPGSPENLKVTTRQDLVVAERILEERRGAPRRGGNVRIGFGHDAHRLVPGRALVLGGVTIPYERGLAGHSDADVILHALVDAILGAAAAGDIGQLFPPTDPAYRDADSRLFLRRAAECVRERGMRIVSVDATLVAQAPRIAPHIPAMRAAIAETLGIDVECVSVKATTTEGMGYTGTGEGMAAYAVATVSD